LALTTLGAQILPAIALSLFVLIGNPLIVMAIMGAMGYRKRTGFLAGLTVAQISEFSLILGAVGLSLGHIDANTLGLITLVGLITISVSTYMILYSHPLYERWGYSRENRRTGKRGGHLSTGEKKFDVILFGVGRFGQGIAQTLRQRGYRVLGVDFDPDLVRRHEGEGYSVRYGDAEAPEFLASLPLEQVQWVLSSVPEKQVNLALLHGLHEQDYKGRVTVTAHSARDAEHLKDAGADRVLIPYADAATEAVDSLFGVNDRQPSEVANKSHTYPVEF
jgi:hypothetical protein